MKKLYSCMAGLLVLAVGAGSLTSSAVSADNSTVAVEATGGAPTLIGSYPMNESTEAMWAFTKLVKFRFSEDVTINRTGEATIILAVPNPIGGGYTAMLTYALSDEANIYLNPADSSELWVNFSDFDFIDNKNYLVIVEAGAVSGNGVANEECSTTFQLINSIKYTTVPASGTTLASPSELENVTVKFDGGGYVSMDFAETSEKDRPKVYLNKIEDGLRTRLATYNVAIDGFNLNLTLNEAPEAVSGAAYYQIVVPAGLVNYMDRDEFTYGTPTIVIDELKCSATPAPAEWGEFDDYITPVLPSSWIANEYNTISAFGDTGMAVIGLGLSTRDFSGVNNSARITYTYSEYLGGAQEELASFESTDENRVSFVGIAGADEPGSLMSYSLYLNMVTDEEGEMDVTLLPKFKRAGYYTLTIPDGAFMADGKLLHGTTLVYQYTVEAGEFTNTFTLDPADGAEISDPKGVFGIEGTGITLTIDGSSFVSTLTHPGKLTCPDGTVFDPNSPKTNFKNNFVWNFGNKQTEWPEGEYIFTIAPGKIFVDMGWAEDHPEGTEGNFPGLTAIYHVKGTSLSVVLVGVESADLYNVFTLDGKAVKVNAKAGELLDLTPGLYIVNGKKTIVRK